MNLAFTTCVRLGESCIEEIYRCGYKLEVVFTLEDKAAPGKSGRIYLDDLSEKYGFDLVKVGNINEEVVPRILGEREIDWHFVVGWSQIVRKPVLDAPRFGTLGIHPTLLPEGRGRAPIPWAILKGLDKTGVTLFKIDEGVDSGPIIDQSEIPIGKRETAATLYEKVEKEHRKLISRNLPIFESGQVPMLPQDESRATYWPGRKPEDGEISEEMTVDEIDRLVRAVGKPYPGAFVWKEGEKVPVWNVSFTPMLFSEGIPIRAKDGVIWVRIENEIVKV